MNTIAYQGVKGAFSYLTAIQTFGTNHAFLGTSTFREMFTLIDRGDADYAIVALENSLIGSIYENYDLINEFDVKIIGEHYMKIEHCLLGVKNARNANHLQLERIQKVYSHPKALEQCVSFFRQHPWIQAVVHMDTAGAAREIASWNDPECAAIASACAGELYGLDLVKRGIQDDPQNYTRFAILSKNDAADLQTDKCSLQLALKHHPGSLAQVLKHFADNGINLTKIESRPMRGRPFEYMFYVDFEFKGITQTTMENILDMVYEEVQMMKNLGFYKAGK